MFGYRIQPRGCFSVRQREVSERSVSIKKSENRTSGDHLQAIWFWPRHGPWALYQRFRKHCHHPRVLGPWPCPNSDDRKKQLPPVIHQDGTFGQSLFEKAQPLSDVGKTKHRKLYPQVPSTQPLPRHSMCVIGLPIRPGVVLGSIDRQSYGSPMCRVWVPGSSSPSPRLPGSNCGSGHR